MRFKNIKGFTLIELLSVIAIIGVLSAFAFTSYSKAQAKTRDVQRKNDLETIKKASQLFYQDENTYPCFVATSCSAQGGGHADPTGTQIATYLVPKYTEKLPTDPRGISCNYMYAVNAGAQEYTIYAKLENTNDPAATAVKPDPKVGSTFGSTTNNITFTVTLGSCLGSYNYWINNP